MTKTKQKIKDNIGGFVVINGSFDMYQREKLWVDYFPRIIRNVLFKIFFRSYKITNTLNSDRWDRKG